MSDIVVGVRLNGDGSGLVGQLKLSETGLKQLRDQQKGAADDARTMSTETGKAAASIGDAATAAAGAAEAVAQLDSAVSDVAAGADKAAGRASALGQSIDTIGDSARGAANDAGRLDGSLSGIGGAIKDTIAGALGLDGALSNVGGSSEETSELAGALDEQLGGLAESALESSAAQGAIAKASGVAAKAMSGFGVTAGAVEGILTGGLSLILPLVTGFLAGFAAEALEGADAMEEQEDAATTLIAQIEALNKALKEETQTQYSARVAALAHAEGQRVLAIRTIEARKALLEKALSEQKATPSWSVAGPGQAIQQAASMAVNATVRELQGQLDAATAALKTANANVGLERQYFVDRGAASATDPRARISLTYDQKLDRLDRTRDQMSEAQYAREKIKLDKERTAALDAVSEAERKATASGKALSSSRSGASAADRAAADAQRKLKSDLDGVTGRYDPARKAAATYADELQRIADLASSGKISADDANNYRAQASAAYLGKVLDMDGIKELGAQEQAAIDASAAIDQIVQSIDDESAALRVLDPVQQAMLGYRKQLLDLKPGEQEAARQRIQAALEEREATEAVTRSLKDAQRQREQAFLTGISDMQENVRQTFEQLRTDGADAIGDFLKRSLDVADRLFADMATEKLFGGLFRDLEGQVTGADKVDKAGKKMSEALNSTSADIVGLGKAAAEAAALMHGDVTATGAIATSQQPTTDLTKLEKNDAFKQLKGGFKEGYGEFFDDLKGDFRDIFSDIFGEKGVFSETLGKTMGQLTAGAQTGATAGNLVTSVLGIKGSTTGGAIGGAIGSAIAGPLGSIVGGTLGSVLGGLTKSTPKASATITGGSDDDVSVSGNKDSLKKASVGLASSVQETLAQIAEEFGGEVGKFAVSIGIRHGDYRVDTTGSGKTKKKSGAIDFDDDQAGAIAYAVMDAITDGGITGISAAIKKALASSDDLDAALEEALKVKEVETILGGLGAELEAQFKTFEKQATERVRIATEYGFDVLAIEKKNAEDRAALVDEILSSRVGSLQTMLDDFKFGDLFEGSLADQRTALLAEIADARTAAEAGEDGAADRLATLSRQLIELSRDAYGTAGSEYTSDRDSAMSSAEAIIKAESDRIKAAQDAATQTNSQLATSNQIANEQTDQLVEMNATLSNILRSLSVNGSSLTVDTSLVARGQ